MDSSRGPIRPTPPTPPSPVRPLRRRGDEDSKRDFEEQLEGKPGGRKAAPKPEDARPKAPREGRAGGDTDGDGELGSQVDVVG